MTSSTITAATPLSYLFSFFPIYDFNFVNIFLHLSSLQYGTICDTRSRICMTMRVRFLNNLDAGIALQRLITFRKNTTASDMCARKIHFKNYFHLYIKNFSYITLSHFLVAFFLLVDYPVQLSNHEMEAPENGKAHSQRHRRRINPSP